MKRWNHKEKKSLQKSVGKRFDFLLILSCILFSVLSIKLYDVMVSHEEEYDKKLVALTYNEVDGASSPRGRILDRNHNVLVDNKAINIITYKKEKGTTTAEMVEAAYLLASHITMDTSKVTVRMKKDFYIAMFPDKARAKITDKEYEKNKRGKLSLDDIYQLKLERITDKDLSVFVDTDLSPIYIYYLMNKGYMYDEKIIKKDASNEEFAYVSENNEYLKGFNTKTDWERSYPYGDTLRGIFGTVSTSTQGIPAEEKDYYLSKGYSLNDRVGLSYLEKQYEEYLKGEKDVYQIVSSHEKKLIKEGHRGNDIVLSIDINLQREIEDILARQILSAKNEPNTQYYNSSTVIIQDPNTGEILAFASKKYENGEIVDNVTSILTSPITPGSIVKGASILVGYNTGAIHIGESMLDECVYIRGMKEKCSSVNNLGVINDITALAKSSNVYQFKTAIRVNGQEYSKNMRLRFSQRSFDLYRDMYHSFGLGVKTGIDLPVESAGYGAKEDTKAGNLLDFVMGQYESYTPLQISQYISTIANGGVRLEPHLLKEIRTYSEGAELGGILLENHRKELNHIDTDGVYFNRMREGFYAVMHSDGGYGRGYIEDSYQASGKTGTSQSFIDTDGDNVIDTETITSSFIGYMPASSPKMSIIVTSPNSSHPNSNINYASLVTMRITKEVTNAYVSMYGLW